MRSPEFWHFFDDVRADLDLRASSFSTIFERLDQIDRPVGIIETGCTREAGNWRGDGNSTVLFDQYARTHLGSTVHSVDIDPAATALCRSLVSVHVTVHTGDSVTYLRSLADRMPSSLPLDLLYLDSYDLNFDDPTPSAMHHLKELTASAPLIRAGTLVAVDDCFVSVKAVKSANGGLTAIRPPTTIDGKGRYVAEYARHIGAEAVCEGYQCVWTKMRSCE